MSDDLLPYYNRELAFIRKLGAQFAAANPKIAGRLRIGSESTEDPHVGRLMEAFALLNARTRYKLEDDFPEISEAMLGVLYPHYLAPIPSMAIVRLALDRSQAELTTGYTVPRGRLIETEPVGGEPCRFRTSTPVTLWPIELTKASLTTQPFVAPRTRFTASSAAVLQLSLQCFSPQMTFAQLPLQKLRFYLKGQSQFTYDVYELLLNNALGVAVANAAGDTQPVVLDRAHIHPVGFESDEGLLEYPDNAFPGYRLLSEYFAFPEKFLFFDIDGLDAQALARLGNRLELFIYTGNPQRDLERHVNTDLFQLGCTPVVNLFSHRAEPIRLTRAQSEYRVVPDARRPASYEIYSIDKVVATSPDDDIVEYYPFYSVGYRGESQEPRTFWQSSRRGAGYQEGQLDPGTEIHLSLVDLDFHPSVAEDWTIDVETTCLNRDLPNRLPFGGGQPYLQLVGATVASQVQCLTPPTITRRPALRHGTRWRLISHLLLNHLSLADATTGAAGLREILKLYDFTDSPETNAMIEAVQSLSTRRVVGRAGGGIAGGFCRGLEITIQFDEARFAGSSAYLFASVLDRFLGLYASINSFTRLIATTNRREGELGRWPARAGDKPLL